MIGLYISSLMLISLTFAAERLTGFGDPRNSPFRKIYSNIRFIKVSKVSNQPVPFSKSFQIRKLY